MGLLRVIKKEDHNSAKIVQILNLTNKVCIFNGGRFRWECN